jgi:hypothetical protein
VEWKRQWARVQHSDRIRPNTKRFDWVYDLKLTSRIGGYVIVYVRTSPEDMLSVNLPEDVLAEITALYAEIVLQNSQLASTEGANHTSVGERPFNAKELLQHAFGRSGTKA